MRVIAWRPLKEFATTHADALTPLRVWRKLIEKSDIETPDDLKRLFGRGVDLLPDGIVIFNIGGHKYRLSARIRYRAGIVYVRHVMTHEEYDRRTRDGAL